MYDYQRIASSRSYGGARAVLTGTIQGVSSGRFNAALAALPDAVNGCIPAGSPIKMDDKLRTVAVHYAFEVAAEVTYLLGATSMSIKVKKGFEGSRARIGMVVGLAPSTYTGDVAIPLTITAIDRTNSAYDTLTVSCTATDAGGTIAAGATLVEVAENDSDNKYYIKVLPNAFTFYDVVKLPNAVEVFIDGLFCQVDGVLLTRRVPPLAACVKTYLREEGNVYVRYSTSEE